jgi:hypothetical protein
MLPTMMMKYDGLIDGLVNSVVTRMTQKWLFDDSRPVNTLHFITVSFALPAESGRQSP